MQRAEAQQVFALIADLKGDLRDRQATERWWLVWVVTGLQIPVTNTLTQMLVWRGEQRAWPYVILWGAQMALVALTIKFIHRRSGGQRSQRETFIWWIWASFLVCGAGVALINTLLRLPLFHTAPVIPLLAAYGFAMMAMAVHRAFIVGSLFFGAVMVAMLVWPRVQFLLYGGAWFVTLEVLGFYFRPPARAARAEAL
jgi:hypothetical protein